MYSNENAEHEDSIQNQTLKREDKCPGLTNDVKFDLGVLRLARSVAIACDAPQLCPVHAGHEVLADVEAEVAV